MKMAINLLVSMTKLCYTWNDLLCINVPQPSALSHVMFIGM